MDMEMLENTVEVQSRSEIEAVFMEHYKEWCLLSYSYMENMSEAEDLVQDVFVNILNRKKNTKILDLKSYISTTVRNSCLKRIQRTRRLEKIKDNSLMASPSHEQFMIRTETTDKVQEAIDVLPEQSKKVFCLCVLEGVKYQNAADVMGISINTVKFHLKKAFKILRPMLRDTYF